MKERLNCTTNKSISFPGLPVFSSFCLVVISDTDNFEGLLASVSGAEMDVKDNSDLSESGKYKLWMNSDLWNDVPVETQMWWYERQW